MSQTIVKLGGSTLDPETGQAIVQAKGAPVDETDDNAAPDFGQVPNMCALGVSALPYQADDDGSAEAIVEDGIPGIDAVMVGGRDTRSAKIVRNLKHGDTCLHSTGPQQAAQVQCKEEKRQTLLITKDERGKDVTVLLDGKNEKITIAGFGQLIEMTRNGINLIERGGGAIIMQNGVVSIVGTVVLGGLTPSAPVLSGTTLSPVPTPGVFVGI